MSYGSRHNFLCPTNGAQICVVADMVALPTFMAESLVKAKGSYGHAALNIAKGVVYGTASSLSSKQKEEEKS
jgi:hypothetical protein